MKDLMLGIIYIVIIYTYFFSISLKYGNDLVCVMVMPLMPVYERKRPEHHHKS